MGTVFLMIGIFYAGVFSGFAILCLLQGGRGARGKKHPEEQTVLTVYELDEAETNTDKMAR